MNQLIKLIIKKFISTRKFTQVNFFRGVFRVGVVELYYFFIEKNKKEAI